MTMKVSNKGLAELASHEGIVKSPYLDSVGVWTIGIGHTANAGSPNPGKMDPKDELTTLEVMELFKKDIGKFEDRVNDAVKVPLTQHQFDALVSFDYNTGGIYKAKLTKSLNNKNYDKAADQFMGWSRPSEIIPRRRAEQDLFRTGRYGNGMANVYKTNGRGKVLWGSATKVDVSDLLGLAEKPVESVPIPPVKPTPSEGGNGLVALLIKLLGKLFK